jgi:hypothetical protein
VGCELESMPATNDRDGPLPRVPRGLAVRVINYHLHEYIRDVLMRRAVRVVISSATTTYSCTAYGTGATSDLEVMSSTS